MRERTRCPRHPGYILKTLYLEPLALTITQLADVLGVSRKAVSAIVNERKSVTPEMALRLAQAFPNSTPESWVNVQRNYDLWQVAHRTSAWRAIHSVVEGAEYALCPDEYDIDVRVVAASSREPNEIHSGCVCQPIL